MARRTRRLAFPEDEEIIEEQEVISEAFENSVEPVDLSVPKYNDAVVKMANKMVRGVFSLEYKKQIINRNNLQRIVWETESFRQIGFDLVFEKCQEILEEVFGMKLMILPTQEFKISGKRKFGTNVATNEDNRKNKSSNKEANDQLTSINENESTRKKNTRSSKSSGSYILISTLSETQKLLLNEFFERSAIKYFDNVHEDMKTLDDKQNLPFTDSNLVSNSLIIIIVSIVALSSNNMNEKELLQYLSNHFGIKEDTKLPNVYNISGGGTSLPGEKITMSEFLRIMEKQEYLNKVVEKSDDLTLIEYSLGRRAKTEFPKESLVKFVQQMFGLTTQEQNAKLLSQIELSLGSSYDNT